MLVVVAVEFGAVVEPVFVPLELVVPVAAPVVFVEPVVELLVLVDPVLEPVVALGALDGDLAVAVVAPDRPGSFPSGAETAPCATAEEFGSLE